MRRRHPIGKTIDELLLATQLGEALGRSVAISTRPATDDDPGVLIVSDPVTGEEIDTDPQLVAQLISAHTPPVRKTSMQTLTEDLDSAITPIQAIGALRAWARREADLETRRRNR